MPGFHLMSTKHIPGTNMDMIDRASRDNELPSDFKNIPFVDTENNIYIQQLLNLCNPTNKQQNCQDHHTLYNNIHTTLHNLFKTLTSHSKITE